MVVSLCRRPKRKVRGFSCKDQLSQQTLIQCVFPEHPLWPGIGRRRASRHMWLLLSGNFNTWDDSNWQLTVCFGGGELTWSWGWLWELTVAGPQREYCSCDPRSESFRLALPWWGSQTCREPPLAQHFGAEGGLIVNHSLENQSLKGKPKEVPCRGGFQTDVKLFLPVPPSEE